MAALNELIQKIENPELRAQIQAAADKVIKQKKFGLVFEDHLPECTPLYDIPARKGLKVSVRKGKANETYTVLKVVDGKATCLPKNGTEAVEFDVVDLVTTAELGDPIYPCLQQLGEVCNAPDSELWHTLIEADNYHALQLLEYLYAGKVDCIYIDPPYNSGATDWKYNNKYVDENDEYRHSKWLSFMKKRLEIAKKLLNPADSVLIVTIDEKEYLHLGCLLEELFTEANIQMISSVINPGGTGRANEFTRVNEYVFFVMIGDYSIHSIDIDDFENKTKAWDVFRRHNKSNTRDKTSTQFYPLYINPDTLHIEVIGDPIPKDMDIKDVPGIEGLVTTFPIRDDGTEMMWGLTPDEARRRNEKGYIKVNSYTPSRPQKFAIQHLMSGAIEDIESGVAVIVGRDKDGSVIIDYPNGKSIYMKNQWSYATHNARSGGTEILKKIIGDRFTYPKSLYAVRDCIQLFTNDKPNALIVDFFAGSGTTLHAVNLLNAEDGGNRRCIMVTNNEISADERKDFESRDIHQGDPEWEARGIAHYVTWPRTTCSILGINVAGNAINDDYVTSQTQIVKKNRNITQITFLDPAFLESLPDKKKIVSLISNGVLPSRIVKEDMDYIVSEDIRHTVSILLNDQKYEEWLEALDEMDHITTFLVVTKNRKLFNAIKKKLQEMFAPVEVTIPRKMPMSDGFKTNAVFFKLGFLDKTKVSLRMQFKELLSTLWMKAGAIGKCPVVDAAVPDMIILPDNKMAVLTDENRFCEFAEQLAQHPEIKVVYLVTDYESSFVAMTQALEGKQTYQLYRDYLDNFRINAGRNSR